MITLSAIGVDVNIFSLLFIELSVGIISGFIGVSDGYSVVLPPRNAPYEGIYAKVT